MPLSKNLSAYQHVKQILDAALPHAKCTFTLPTSSAAIRWRQEAYYFRKLSGSPAYDNLIFRLDGLKVIIEKRVIPGVLTTHDGTTIEPAATSELDGDLSEMEKHAFDFAKRLGLEVEEDD